MNDDACRDRLHGKKPARPSARPPAPPSTSGSSSDSMRSVSNLLSIPAASNLDLSMSLLDIHKAFTDVGKLTGPDTWPMWKFRVNTALQTVIDWYQFRGGLTVPSEVGRAVFNVMAGHIVDSVMANYLNKSKPHVLMDKLRECFDPKTTIRFCQSCTLYVGNFESASGSGRIGSHPYRSPVTSGLMAMPRSDSGCIAVRR